MVLSGAGHVGVCGGYGRPGLPRGAWLAIRNSEQSSKRRVQVAGRIVTLGQYLAAVKRAKANPDAVFWRSFRSDWCPATGREIYREFLAGMQERITRGVPRSAWWRPHVYATVAPPEKYLWKHLRRRGRECAWCGKRFKPEAVTQRCCSPGCAEAYGWW